MPRASRIYLDTNVFIKIFEGTDEVSKRLTSMIVDHPENDRQVFATSELTLAELLGGPLRNQDQDLIEFYDGWLQSNDMLEVGPVNRDVLWIAAILRSQHDHLKLPDAIHLSTAMHFKCSHLLTADQRIRDSYDLTVTRYGITRDPVSAAVIRPEIGVLDKLEIGSGA